MLTQIAPTPSAPLPHTALLGLGVSRPSRILTNDDVAGPIDSSDEWIRTRSGIETRRWCGPGESLFTLGAEAARRAVAASGLDPSEINCVIVATSTNFRQTPAAAPRIAKEAGIVGVPAFDVAAGCAGFCHALGLASDMVRGGTARNVLVVGAEELSVTVNPKDRSTAFLFADGAGAVVVSGSDTVAVGPTVWGSDADHYSAIEQDKTYIDYIGEVAEQGAEAVRPWMKMDGPQVFRWVVQSLEKVCREALDRAGVVADDLDALIPHQANGRISDAIARALKVKDSCAMATDIRNQGNTSAASVPLAMEELLRTGKAQPGGLALLVAFGAGMSYAAQVVRLPGILAE